MKFCQRCEKQKELFVGYCNECIIAIQLYKFMAGPEDVLFIAQDFINGLSLSKDKNFKPEV